MGASTPAIAPFLKTGAETCEFIGRDVVYWSRGPQVLISDGLQGPLRQLARVPRPLFQRLVASTRLGRRMARETIYNILPLANGNLFFTYGTEIGIMALDGRVTLLTGRRRAHRVLRGGVAVMPDGSVIFGEYFDNAEREAVSLYRARSGEKAVTEVYRFAPGEVRHIHAVRWDAVSARAIVCSGDIGGECRIMAFAPDFTSHEVWGAGTEEWRTISPQFGAEAVYFGTDAQFMPNRLLRYDRNSGQLETLALVNGPVFYSAALTNGWLFGTTAELCSSQISPEAILYFIDAETEAVSIVARFEKDKLPTRLFQFGILNLPLSDAPQALLPVSGVALKRLDGRFFLAKIDGART